MADAKDELICDFAEVYRVYDYQALPITLAATLVCGLGANSRTMQKLTGTRYTQTEFLLAAIADRLSYLVWFKTEDGAKNRNRPKSFVEEMTGEKKEKNNKPMAFNNGDDLKAALARFEEA